MGDNVEIVGIANGYSGLINGDYREMNEDDFRGILTLGGTILGTKRTPFKLMRVVEEDKIDKVAAMKKTYKDAKLDCLLCLGGNGTHKTANLLSQEGLNIIGLPKTIDNDIYGTDVTFGFHTAVVIIIITANINRSFITYRISSLSKSLQIYSFSSDYPNVCKSLLMTTYIQQGLFSLRLLCAKLHILSRK